MLFYGGGTTDHKSPYSSQRMATHHYLHCTIITGVPQSFRQPRPEPPEISPQICASFSPSEIPVIFQ
jgi:hypothetical protein